MASTRSQPGSCRIGRDCSPRNSPVSGQPVHHAVIPAAADEPRGDDEAEDSGATTTNASGRMGFARTGHAACVCTSRGTNCPPSAGKVNLNSQLGDGGRTSPASRSQHLLGCSLRRNRRGKTARQMPRPLLIVSCTAKRQSVAWARKRPRKRVGRGRIVHFLCSARGERARSAGGHLGLVFWLLYSSLH